MSQPIMHLHNQQRSNRCLTLAGVVFDEDYLLALAKSSEFYKRSPRKIDVCTLLASLCSEGIKGSPSCNDLAASIETSNPGCGPSRQAVHLRLGDPFQLFIHRLLEDVMSGRLAGVHIGQPKAAPDAGRFAGYSRVVVQDSTIIKLPKHLFEEFSGVSNGHSQVCNARIQVIYDLVSKKLIDFSIDPYSKNDLTAAPELPLEQGDLVLRDRGYLVLGEIKRHVDAGADCVYRHKTGTIYLHPQTHEPIDLAKMLRQCGHLDTTVLRHNEARTPVRLVSAPVSEEIANLRRMKARKENHGHNPSKAVMELMDWTIFITTITPASATFDRLLAVYGLRWRIEVIFKAWKSHLKFAVLHCVSKRQMLILLKAKLLLITCCTNILHGPLERILRQKYNARISILKLLKYLCTATVNLLRAFSCLFSLSSDCAAEDFLRAILRYCCYDQRKRQNYTQIWEDLT